jgi:hypothetical protein
MRPRSLVLLLGSASLVACSGIITKASSSGSGSGGSLADSGSGGSPVGGGSGGSPDGGGGSPDGGCIVVTAGEPCMPDETACQPAEPCCVGYWFCDPNSHTWKLGPLGCPCGAPPFACGSMGCVVGFYCEVTSPGCLPNGAACTSSVECCTNACSGGTCGDVAPPDSGTFPDTYACVPIPSSCLAVPGCACIEATLPPGCSPPAGTCTEDSSGHVTIHCPGV